ncbi:DUF4265 domain-containing protein [Kribbella sp. CA-247076]|uniref:DUF4265 domain-containing protein n=1 Tax=Kribbella sp. CA-247076 TaxID=3239941 RepID=UPI003D9493E5
MNSEAVHREPVWRDRSNFVIATRIEPGQSGVSTEQLWARCIDDLHYELCCIPFFAYDLALGDVVEVDASYMVRRVTKGSGRSVFRVYFGRSEHPTAEIVEHLTGLGGLVEWSSENLLAVDAPDQATAQPIADYLQEQEDLGRLMYETGKTT